VVGSTALLLSAVGYDSVVAGGRGTVDGVAGMVTLDLPTYVRLVSVTGEQLPKTRCLLYMGRSKPSVQQAQPAVYPVWRIQLSCENIQ